MKMQYGRSHFAFSYLTGTLSLPSSLLSFVALLPMSTLAQSTTPSLTPEATLSTPTSHSRIEPTRSMTTFFISSTASTNTSFTTSTSTPTASDVFPSNGHLDAKQGVLKYYWLILLIFGALVAVFLWWANRKRRKRKEQMRLSGQNALARDLDGWINTPRWFHGTWRPNQTQAFVRREEGLNEHGEAPPPYQPKSEVSVTQGSSHDPASGLSVPLRTLSRDGVDAGRPPEYR